MSGTYLDGDTLALCHNALRDGITLERLAGQLRCEPEDLANLLGLPQWKTVPVSNDQDGDLWAVDRLNEVL